MTWPTKKLGEVCDIVKSGITPFDGEKEYIDTNSVQNFSIVKQQIIIYKKRPSRANMEAKANDVLVAKMKDTVKVYLATLEDEKKRIFSTGFFVLRPKKDLVRPKFLFLYCSSDIFQNLKDELARGSTQKAINDEKLKKYFEIPFPPLEIQKQIVARIEELFEKIDKAKELREKSREETEKIFNSFAQEIFKKIEKKWAKKKLEEIGVFKRGPFGGSLKKEIFVENGYKVYEQRNAIYDDFTLGNYYITENKYQEMISFAIKPGDLIISCSGTIGKVAMVPQGIKPGIINQALLKIIPFTELIFGRYLKAVIESPQVQEKLFRNTLGSAIHNVASVNHIKKLEIPLPPLPEQKKIVVELDDLREKVEKLKKIQKEQLKDLEELKKSILDKAFKGELI